MDKKLRFGDLVRNSGRPQIITLWTEPGKNHALTRAIKGNRLLTIIQQPGKRDYGRIGFQMQPGASFLLFPRALPKEPDATVVGVNYQLVEEPAVADPIRPEHTKSSRPAKAKPEERKPTMQRCAVRVRQTATIEKELDVKAPNQATAEKQALERVKKEAFDLDKASVRAEAVKE